MALKNSQYDVKEGLDTMARMAHDNSRDKGFWDGITGCDPKVIPEKLCLIHSEVSETLEAYRNGKLDEYQENGKPEGCPAELADIVIRVGDLCGHMGWSLGSAVVRKMQYNAGRERMHGKVC